MALRVTSEQIRICSVTVREFIGSIQWNDFPDYMDHSLTPGLRAEITFFLRVFGLASCYKHIKFESMKLHRWHCGKVVDACQLLVLEDDVLLRKDERELIKSDSTLWKAERVSFAVMCTEYDADIESYIRGFLSHCSSIGFFKCYQHNIKNEITKKIAEHIIINTVDRRISQNDVALENDRYIPWYGREGSVFDPRKSTCDTYAAVSINVIRVLTTACQMMEIMDRKL